MRVEESERVIHDVLGLVYGVHPSTGPPDVIDGTDASFASEAEHKIDVLIAADKVRTSKQASSGCRLTSDTHSTMLASKSTNSTHVPRSPVSRRRRSTFRSCRECSRLMYRISAACEPRSFTGYLVKYPKSCNLMRRGGCSVRTRSF